MLPKTQQGGAETQLLYLIQGLDRNKFQVYLGLLYKDNQLKEEFESIPGITIKYFNKKSKWDALVFFRIKEFIIKNEIDIVHSFLGNHYAYIPALMCKNTVGIGSIRATAEPKHLSFIERLTEFTLPKLFQNNSKFIIIANSHKGRAIYLKQGFSCDSIKVIPNGIDYGRFSNGNRKRIINEFNLRNKLVLGMVARLVEGKNHEELIKIFKKLTEKHNNLVLLIIGSGPLMNYLKDLTKESKLNNVVFTGNRKDIPDFLASINIFVFPSKFPEGWPNVIGEAMAAGVSIVSYPAGDIKYIIKNNYNGIITRPDSHSFMTNVTKLIKSKKRREYLGDNARKTILNNFSLPKMVKKYQDVYNKIRMKND